MFVWIDWQSTTARTKDERKPPRNVTFRSFHDWLCHLSYGWFSFISPIEHCLTMPILSHVLSFATRIRFNSHCLFPILHAFKFRITYRGELLLISLLLMCVLEKMPITDLMFLFSRYLHDKSHYFICCASNESVVLW